MVLTSIGLWAKIQPQNTSEGLHRVVLLATFPLFSPPPLPSVPISKLGILAHKRINPCEGEEEHGGICSSKAGSSSLPIIIVINNNYI